MTDIPVLDAGWPDDELALAFGRAFGDLGFAYLVGHGIDTAQVFAASARFHALPLAEKLRIGLDANHRGFIAKDTSTDVTSTLADVTRPNQSESFMMMREDGPDAPDVFLAGPNQWPDLPGFREAVSAYHDRLAALGHRLIGVAAQAVGADPDALLKHFDPPTTWLRLLHYPPLPTGSPDDLYGSAPHCDFGALTILAQDDVGGLDVQTPQRAWIDVPPRPGAFIVNVGDMLHRWTNGRLRSTPHRVINRAGRARYSVAFFYDPFVETVIEPLPACIAPDKPAAFAPLKFADFLRGELGASYDRHKSHR